jgi:hypothetical protein
MAFETFNLGNVIQTAEAIKGMRAQGTTDRLREQYLGEQIQGMRADRASKERAEQVVLGKEKAQQIAVKSDQILQAPNPKNYAEQFEPDLVKALTSSGVDWAVESDESVRERVTAMKNRANQELGVSPIQAQEVGGFQTLQQGGKVVASATPQKAANAPQSYDEYVLSQKDPDFAKFLAARKGKGLSVTLPDGTVVEMGGGGGGEIGAGGAGGGLAAG